MSRPAPSQTPIPATQPILTSQGQGWQNLVVEEHKQPPGAVASQSWSEHAIGLCLAARPYQIRQVMDRQRHTGSYSRGDISITPAGTPLTYEWDGNDHYLQIQLKPEFLQQVAAETTDRDPARLELLPKFQFRDRQLEQIGLTLQAELQTGSFAGPLLVESLTNVLAVHLLRNYSSLTLQENLPVGGLPPHLLAIAQDYIQTHLEFEITIADLAQTLGMSQFHLARCFKQSMGISPHQYILQQRIERSKQLLCSPLSIAEVAFQCGFSSHSHFGKWFRQATGLTPKMYRNIL